jgi:hypothetical protein
VIEAKPTASVVVDPTAALLLLKKLTTTPGDASDMVVDITSCSPTYMVVADTVTLLNVATGTGVGDGVGDGVGVGLTVT